MNKSQINLTFKKCRAEKNIFGASDPIISFGAQLLSFHKACARVTMTELSTNSGLSKNKQFLKRSHA